MTVTDHDPGDEDDGWIKRIKKAIARFESGIYTPEQRAEIGAHEARINSELRAAAREHDLILAWSKVHGANKVYR